MISFTTENFMSNSRTFQEYFSLFIGLLHSNFQDIFRNSRTFQEFSRHPNMQRREKHYYLPASNISRRK